MIVDDLIFDVGMHVGKDSEFYLRKGFRVVAVEANPELCRLVQRTLPGHLRSGRLIVVNRALADREGQVVLHVNDQESEWSTIDASWAARNAQLGTSHRQLSVEAMRPHELFAVHGVPHYLKIDIEGADLLCLEALHHFDDRPRFVSVEVQQRSFDDQFRHFAALWSLGYRHFQIVPQHRVPSQRCPLPAREGRSVTHRFELGSSGLFGCELPGRWLTLEEAFRVYARIARAYRLFGLESTVRTRLRALPRLLDRVVGWYDLHAAREACLR